MTDDYSVAVSELRLLQLLQLSAIQELLRLCGEMKMDVYAIAGTLLGAVRHRGFIPWDTDADFCLMRKDYERFIEQANEMIDPRFVIQSDYSDDKNRTCFARLRIVDTVINESGNSVSEKYSGFYIDIFPIDSVKALPSSLDIIHHRILKVLIRAKAFKRGKRFSSTKWKSLVSWFMVSPFLLVPVKLLNSYINSFMKRHSNSACELVTNYNSKYGLVRQTMTRDIYGEPSFVSFEGLQLPAPAHVHEWLSKIYGEYSVPPPIKIQGLQELLHGYEFGFGPYMRLLNISEREVRLELGLPLSTI